ncbi:uncharacterized protein VTP21DRAFT_3096 [Calcarisporiella thermophila]|uniref:uncharacterized protein n=1 Tax=Calcarisporiella thermophila TaxID=911321 RepID=UPI00374236F6
MASRAACAITYLRTRSFSASLIRLPNKPAHIYNSLSPRPNVSRNNSSAARPRQSLRVAIPAVSPQHQFQKQPTEIKETAQKTDVTPRFRYVVAASWHPKKTESVPVNNQSIPLWRRRHGGNKKVDAGEDAFFHVATAKGLAMGVADGVGGWIEVGVDPALFSWTLMDHAARIAKALPVPRAEDTEEEMDAQRILTEAFEQLVNEGSVKAGSSTACILDLCKRTGRLTSANLGDSGFLIIRDGQVFYQAPSLQHFFNCPYQLTIAPSGSGEYILDKPGDALRTTQQLYDGDFIILATDGLFDNLYNSEALAIVNAEAEAIAELRNKAKEDGMDSEQIADQLLCCVRNLSRKLTETARRFSLDPKRMSPWAQSAREHGGRYLGGKVDDITVLIAYVTEGGERS